MFPDVRDVEGRKDLIECGRTGARRAKVRGNLPHVCMKLAGVTVIHTQR